MSVTSVNAGTERALNLSATFLPMVATEPATLPCLVIGGVQVYAYVKDGELRVSLNYDTADKYLLGSEERVPTRINVNGRDVFVE